MNEKDGDFVSAVGYLLEGGGDCDTAKLLSLTGEQKYSRNAGAASKFLSPGGRYEVPYVWITGDYFTTSSPAAFRHTLPSYKSALRRRQVRSSE